MEEGSVCPWTRAHVHRKGTACVRATEFSSDRGSHLPVGGSPSLTSRAPLASAVAGLEARLQLCHPGSALNE